MRAKVNLYRTHPNLFWSALTFALMSVGLGCNFLAFKPPFIAFEIDHRIVGVVFLVVGLIELAALLIVRNLKTIRATMAVGAGLMMLWGIGTSVTFFTNQTTFQLSILYAGLTILKWLWCREPFLNPATSTTNGSDDRP